MSIDVVDAERRVNSFVHLGGTRMLRLYHTSTNGSGTPGV
jgi:hypothetical protein